MCVSEPDSAKFIRRREAAIKYMKELLDIGQRYQKELFGPEAIQLTTDKFNLNASVRDDYRIFKTLWALLD